MSTVPPAPTWYQSARLWAIAAVLTLLAIVGTAAAVLSFSAIRDLAELCGFDSGLAWLLPITIDAGAAAATVVWLARRLAPKDARRFACGLALTLLTLSVAANSVGHYLVAERQAPSIWVVIAVSAIAPATLGAVVHLAVLARRAPDEERDTAPLDVRSHVRPRNLASVRTPADEEDGHGYPQTLRAEAAEYGMTLAPAPGGEDQKARRARVHSERQRVIRERKRRQADQGRERRHSNGSTAPVPSRR